jgi:hypothetical protein
MDDDWVDQVAALIYNCNHTHNDWERLTQVTATLMQGIEIQTYRENTEASFERNRRCARDAIEIVRPQNQTH